MKLLPGTTLELTLTNSEQWLNSLFSTGGLVLSQVCTITGLEGHMVQNWVKRKFVPPPIDKKYSKNQLCRIITINMLKDVLNMDMICSLISHINGVLSDDSDDLITDSQLYIHFVDLVVLCNCKKENLDENIKAALQDYVEPAKGARKKLEDVLKIMFNAYVCAEYKKETLLLFKMSEIQI